MSTRFERAKNDGRHALNSVQCLRECVAITAIELDIVLRGLTDVEPDGFADDVGHGLRFKFARVT
jgi:hypothetical protein